jgi:hypothetical protein
VREIRERELKSSSRNEIIITELIWYRFPFVKLDLHVCEGYHWLKACEKGSNIPWYGG